MSRYVSFRDFDWLLFAYVIALCGLGVMQVYSSTAGTKFSGFHVKQMYWILAGVGMMFVLSLINYVALLENIHWVWIGGVFSLMAVMVVGQRYLGAKRWIRLPGGLHFQPSEWVKLIVILAMAKFFAELRREVSWSDIVKIGLIGGVPCLLVLVEPDLGTALTYTPAIFLALFLGGIRAKQVAVLLIAFCLVAPLAWHHMKAYQKARLTSFIHPEDDPQGSGYQVEQSKIAVGSGGIWGKGLRKGSQTQGAFLPFAYTDFAFSAFSEEHGFVGALLVLLLYFMVLMRLISNAQTAPDRAGAFVIMGVVAVLAFHILVNIGMVVGFMPVTGIPLPLLSYGGSSVLFTFLSLGIVQNIRMRRFVN